jgi:hypothetical protein
MPPSLAEGTPTVLLEAQAAGLPVPGRRFVEERHDIVDLDVRLAALFERLVGGRAP